LLSSLQTILKFEVWVSHHSGDLLSQAIPNGLFSYLELAPLYTASRETISEA